MTSDMLPEDQRPGTLQLSLHFASGCIGTITTGFRMQRYRTSGIEIHGTTGTLQYMGHDWDPKGLEVWTVASECWQQFEADVAWPWTEGVRDFCHSIIGDRASEMSMAQTLHVLDIIDRALASLDDCRPMTVASRFDRLVPRPLADKAAAHLSHNPLTLT